MRHLIRVLVLLVVGVAASLVGVLVALTLTPPGRALLARNVSHQLGVLLRGEVLVGNIEGSFLRDLVLTNVVVREGDRNVIDETVAPGRTVRLTTNP